MYRFEINFGFLSVHFYYEKSSDHLQDKECCNLSDTKLSIFAKAIVRPCGELFLFRSKCPSLVVCYIQVCSLAFPQCTINTYFLFFTNNIFTQKSVDFKGKFDKNAQTKIYIYQLGLQLSESKFVPQTQTRIVRVSGKQWDLCAFKKRFFQKTSLTSTLHKTGFKCQDFIMGHSWPLFLYFVFLIELHVNKAADDWIEPRTSGDRSDHSTNLATTSSQIFKCKFNLFPKMGCGQPTRYLLRQSEFKSF